MAHIFHTHFNGRKHILLFDYKWKERFVSDSIMPLMHWKIMISRTPDFSKFPALDGEGIECYLGTWRYFIYANRMVALDEVSGWFIFYFTRAWDKSWGVKAHSLWNLTVQRKFDNFMKSSLQKSVIWTGRKKGC